MTLRQDIKQYAQLTEIPGMPYILSEPAEAVLSMLRCTFIIFITGKANVIQFTNANIQYVPIAITSAYIREI